MKRLYVILIIGSLLLTLSVHSAAWAKKMIMPSGEKIDLSFILSTSSIISEITGLVISPPRQIPEKIIRNRSAPVLQEDTDQLPDARQTPVQTESSSPLPLAPDQPTTESSNIQNFTLTIPKMNLQNITVTPANLAEESSWREALKHGVAQTFYRPSMGHKILIFGHSSRLWWDTTAKVLFQTLNKLENGDNVYLSYQGKQYVYEVYKTEIVSPDTPSIMTDYGWEELVLFTCWPVNTDRERLVVYTKPVDQTQ